MIELDESFLIGKGKNREVYLHPDDQGKLLKILKPDHSGKRKRRQKAGANFLISASFYDPNSREFNQNSKVRKRHPSLRRHVNEVYGYVKTSLGQALVVEHIRNDDGSTSKNAGQYINDGNGEFLINPMKDLFELLADKHVCMQDGKPLNIAVRRKSNQVELVIVDGLGFNTNPLNH